jgi:hypothetical protein
MKKPEKEEFEFDLTWRDFPNFRRTPRIDNMEEVIGTLMEESKIQKARIERLELEREIA